MIGMGGQEMRSQSLHFLPVCRVDCLLQIGRLETDCAAVFARRDLLCWLVQKQLNESRVSRFSYDAFGEQVGRAGVLTAAGQFQGFLESLSCRVAACLRVHARQFPNQSGPRPAGPPRCSPHSTALLWE